MIRPLPSADRDLLALAKNLEDGANDPHRSPALKARLLHRVMQLRQLVAYQRKKATLH